MLGVKPYNVRQLSTATFINGKRTPGIVGDIFVILANSQPISGSNVKNIADSIREKVEYVLYTKVELQTIDKERPHQIEINGFWYNIHGFQNWDTMLKHFKYALIKVEE